MSKENHENEKMDAASVYVMFEELKDEMKDLTEAARAVQTAITPATPALEPGDGEKIETLTGLLASSVELMKRPMRLMHSIDFTRNVGLVAFAGLSALLVASLFVIHSQGDTIARNRDNDLKYRYIQMQGEAAPADIERLREHFEWNRNPDTIRQIRRQVKQYERIMQQKSEEDAREKTAAANSERLQNAAESVKTGRK